MYYIFNVIEIGYWKNIFGHLQVQFTPEKLSTILARLIRIIMQSFGKLVPETTPWTQALALGFHVYIN